MYAVGYEVYHHPPYLLTGLHSIGCKCKLINFNQYDLGSVFLWPHILLYPLSVRRNFVMCLHKTLLKFVVMWVKKVAKHWCRGGSALLSFIEMKRCFLFRKKEILHLFIHKFKHIS
jgi:hypothetical protein